LVLLLTGLGIAVFLAVAPGRIATDGSSSRGIDKLADKHLKK
jgi:hypothetical protein